MIAVTLGDVAGIGPEVLLRSWADLQHRGYRLVVVGSGGVLRRWAPSVAPALAVTPWASCEPLITGPTRISCVEGSDVAVADLEPGRVHARAGRAAFDYLVRAADLALAGQVDAIVTLPLNKEGLRAAGLTYPGHTEILAERTGAENVGMMLYRRGLGVLHVTLHTALRDAIAALTTEKIEAKIRLLDAMMRRLEVPSPRLGVAALNPHASDGGLFGDEEERLIRPAVHRACRQGIVVSGPHPADTLFVRATEGEFDGVIAMYHDQGHIALKLLGWKEAVNVTVGLPIVRTSVAHGTGYDIVGRGQADPTSFVEAVAVAELLCRTNAPAGSASV